MGYDYFEVSALSLKLISTIQYRFSNMGFQGGMWDFFGFFFAANHANIRELRLSESQITQIIGFHRLKEGGQWGKPHRWFEGERESHEGHEGSLRVGIVRITDLRRLVDFTEWMVDRGRSTYRCNKFVHGGAMHRTRHRLAPTLPQRAEALCHKRCQNHRLSQNTGLHR